MLSCCFLSGSSTAGIYLVSSVRTEQDGKYYVFESFLAAVPGVDSEGQWVYSVSARPKMSVHTPAKGEVTYKVVKAWRDGGKDRPVSVCVEIRRDGQLQQSVTLYNGRRLHPELKTVLTPFRYSYCLSVSDSKAFLPYNRNNVPSFSRASHPAEPGLPVSEKGHPEFPTGFGKTSIELLPAYAIIICVSTCHINVEGGYNHALSR